MGTVILIYLIAGALYLLILYRLIKSATSAEAIENKLNSIDFSLQQILIELRKNGQTSGQNGQEMSKSVAEKYSHSASS